MTRSVFIKRFFVLLIAIVVGITTTAPVCAASLNQIEKKRSDVKQKIQNIKKLEKKEKDKLVRNQRQLEYTTGNLVASKNKYNNLESQLASLESQLNRSIEDYNKSNGTLRSRIKYIYKHQRRGMFQMLFTATDLNTMLDTVYFEKIILKKDYSRIQALKAKSDSIVAIKADIQQKKLTLASTIKDINSQQKSIESAIAQNRSMINKLKNNRQAYERSEKELAKQSASIRNMITKSTNNKTQVSYASSGSFLKPIGGGITSPFGWRVHPIFKSRTFHSGVDIGGPNGGTIKASNAGKVIYSGWYGGYGKVVILDHGVVNGRPTTTLYAHMSSIAVAKGQTVAKGQAIGREGSTGYSTGPHCHFEVRINGSPNNPLSFI